MIQFAANHGNEIMAHGERDYPYECCGLLLGSFAAGGMKAISEIYPISNAREEQAKRNRFLIRPEELMRGERYAETKGLDVVSFYHSHPIIRRCLPSTISITRGRCFHTLSFRLARAAARDIRSWEMEPDRSRLNEEEISVDLS